MDISQILNSFWNLVFPSYLKSHQPYVVLKSKNPHNPAVIIIYKEYLSLYKYSMTGKVMENSLMTILLEIVVESVSVELEVEDDR